MTDDDEIRPKNIPQVIAFNGLALVEHYEKLTNLHIEQLVEICHMITDISKDNPIYLIEFLNKLQAKFAKLADSLHV